MLDAKIDDCLDRKQSDEDVLSFIAKEDLR